MNKLQELKDEFILVFSGRGVRVLDSLFPLILFLIFNSAISLTVALWGSIGIALFFTLLRLVQKESPVYALGGLGGVLLAAVFATLSGSGEGFFIPGLISNAVTIVLCVVSVLINRPLVAWTSHFVRRWPRTWYWHPKVLPAYNEVTVLWGVVYAARLVLEFRFLGQGEVETLGTLRLILGWPLTILLLIVSYLYGIWRLGNLQGPSIEEFKRGEEPPWESQRRGF
jgi:hypothetical protein